MASNFGTIFRRTDEQLKPWSCPEELVGKVKQRSTAITAPKSGSVNLHRIVGFVLIGSAGER